MPRIDLLKATNRMQVANPTGFQNPSDARQNGEAIAQFGDTLARAGTAVYNFQQDTKDLSRKLKVDLAREMLRANALESKNKALTQYKSPSGDDIIGIYEKSYDEKAKSILEGITDADVRGAVAVEVEKQRNSEAESVAKGSMDARVDAFQTMRRETLGASIQNVMKNPAQAAQAIMQNNAALDEMPMDAGAKSASKKEEAKNIALAAVMAMKDSNNYKGARELVSRDLAPFLGADTLSILEDLNKSESKYHDDVLKDADENEKRQNKVRDQVEDDHLARLYTKMLSAGPDERQQVMREAADLQARGIIRPGVLDKLENKNKDILSAGSGERKNYYLADIAQGKGKAGMVNKILSDPQLDADDKSSLIARFVGSKRATQTPQQKLEFNQGIKEIKVAAGGSFDAQLNDIVVPGANQQSSLQVIGRYTDYVSQGMSPKKASKKAIAEHYGEIKATEFLPEYIVPLSQQNSVKDLQEVRAKITKEADRLFQKGDAESKRRATEILRIYKSRSTALSNLEANKADSNGR